MAAATHLKISYAEYLAAERRSEVKHEFVRGDVWAMAGGTPEHARLASSFARELGLALRDRPCAVFSSDLRVRIEAADRATYPDVTVVRGKRETSPRDADAIVNPVMIVEVLSETTEASDRGEKFEDYRRIPSLREYVLVSQRAPHIEVFRLEGDHWSLYEARSGGSIRLASIDVALSVDEVYRDPLEAPNV